MKKNINLILVVFQLTLFLISGCEKEKTDISKTITYGNLKIIKGDNQSGTFGEILKDSIKIKASSTSNHRRYQIKYEMVQGNGVVYHNYSFASPVLSVDSTGILKLRWRLGCDNAVQSIRFLLYVDSAKSKYGMYSYFKDPSATITITSNGEKPVGWGRACGCENFNIHSTRIITYDNKTLYLVSRGLYSSTDGGVNWKKVEGIKNWQFILDAKFNSKGWMYVTTENDGICYSKDMKRWDYINNAVLDYRYPTSILVEDSVMYAGFLFGGLYKTSDNGNFWRRLLIPGLGSKYFEISRHLNGDIYLFDDDDNLIVSNDFGKHWKRLSIDPKYTHYEIYDIEIDKNGKIYIGAGDATISILDPISYQGEFHNYYQLNHSSQNIDHIQVTDNDVYFLVNGTPLPGLYSKSFSWGLVNTGFAKPVRYYYPKPDNTFLLLSDDGLYYFNK
jgi:hypothetical protein